MAKWPAGMVTMFCLRIRRPWKPEEKGEDDQVGLPKPRKLPKTGGYHERADTGPAATGLNAKGRPALQCSPEGATGKRACDRLWWTASRSPCLSTADTDTRCSCCYAHGQRLQRKELSPLCLDVAPKCRHASCCLQSSRLACCTTGGLAAYTPLRNAAAAAPSTCPFQTPGGRLLSYARPDRSAVHDA